MKYKRSEYWKDQPKSDRAKSMNKRFNSYIQKRKARDKKVLERENLLKVIGDKCLICGSKKRLFLHEVYGKKHPSDYSYILSHAKDFVPLCYKCHMSVHWLMSVFKLSWIQILSVVEYSKSL